jgi:hypothetical protein
MAPREERSATYSSVHGDIPSRHQSFRFRNFDAADPRVAPVARTLLRSHDLYTSLPHGSGVSAWHGGTRYLCKTRGFDWRQARDRATKGESIWLRSGDGKSRGR